MRKQDSTVRAKPQLLEQIRECLENIWASRSRMRTRQAKPVRRTGRSALPEPSEDLDLGLAARYPLRTLLAMIIRESRTRRADSARVWLLL